MRLDRPTFENFKPGNYPSSAQFDVVELKFDGWWGQLLIENGVWQIYSRTGKLKQEGPFCESVDRTIIHGEFLYGTEWSKDRPHLYEKLACHSITMLNGDSVTHYSNAEMRNTLRDFLFVCSDEAIVKRCFLVDQFQMKHASKIWEEYVVGQKFEGLVFKRSTAPWTSSMGRMKQTATMDYVCMDVLESDSATYAGWGAQSIVGGLYVNGKLMKICKVSGMTDEQRKEFLQNKKSYIGRVFECEGKKISKKGAVRHPNFLRWRDDKAPKDCKW